MTREPLYVRLRSAVKVLLVLSCTQLLSQAKELTVVRTNQVDHWFTNVIEVTMPANRFVNAYRTNWVQVFRTNNVNLFKTNLITLQRTNVWDTYRTNIFTRNLTNVVPVHVFETNLVTAYATNWKAFTVTNWETVLVFKTNWAHQAVTNVVQVDLPAKPAPSITPAPRQEPTVQAASAAPGQSFSQPFRIEATKGGTSADGRVHVTLKLRSTLTTSEAVPIQQWRVESEDGRILSFALESEFKRELPLGRYKVEVKTKGDRSKAGLTTRGTLTITATGAVVQYRLASTQ